MKLVKIDNVRVGQIWTFNEGQTYDLVIDVRTVDPDFRDCLYEVNYIIYGDLEYNIEHKKEKGDNYFIDAEYCRRDEPASNDILEKFEDMNNLVGFLGITHEIKDNKLIEIPRKEFEEDDIILKTNFYRNEYGDIVGQFTKKICYNGYIDKLEKLQEENDKIEKIGTLGVNYEFINNKLGE